MQKTVGSEKENISNHGRILNKDRIRRIVCGILSVCAALFLMQAVTVNRSLAAERKVADTQKELAKEVFRFHVLADSDSEEDQEVKLKVRDAVIAYMREDMQAVTQTAAKADGGVTKSSAKTSDGSREISLAETKTWAREHLEEIEALAEKILREEGFDYGAKAQVATCYFPDKTYGDVFFPKGTYEALRIELGRAKGQNWWCVLYPNLCFTDAAYSAVDEEGHEELERVLTDDEYEMVTASSQFKIKSYFFGDLF